ncbi:acetyltransferase [Cryobacterium algoritolerans]|uniref:Acetyltransferase n=1 Tax=Cryobacterium algoritolerans TaxID=1259184 RepID=A0A4R8WT54_9MICO|nr:acyltransferase family protein [Cryobacterium algoritolerans]TFC14025.1 acetyltransferase [Cryobacterium algoritolerans]
MNLSRLSPTAARPDSDHTVPETKRLAGLDGLRGMAVTLVVVYHFFPAALPGGFVGVDVFFVISGFLITGLLLAEHRRTGRFTLGRFWQRRALRLLPPLIPLILVACTAAWLIGGDVLVGLGGQVLGAMTFGYNWVSIAGSASYFDTTQPELFRNLWSLAVEEQFYLVWPFVLFAVLLIRGPWRRVALVGGLAVAAMLWMGVLFRPGSDPTRVYYGSDSHSFGLFAGAALALLLAPGARGTSLPRLHVVLGLARSWLGLAAFAGLLAAAWALPATGAVTYRGGLVAVSLLSAIVIWAAVRGVRFGPSLDLAPLRYLGERSYGLYLWHWPVLVLVQVAWPAAARAYGQAGAPAGLAAGVLAGTLTLIAAATSYRWLERPVRSYGVRGGIRRLSAATAGYGARRRVLVALGAAAVLLFVAGTTSALVTAPRETSAQQAIDRGQTAMDAAARVAAKRAAVSSHRPLPGGSMITAVGDSVMLASAPELQSSFPGISIDAAVNRGMRSASGILAALNQAGTLRSVVVVGLGTNGPINEDELAAIQTVIGPNRQLIMVNAFADRDWTPGVNAALADFSARYSRVELANWHDAIAPHSDVLAEDNIHPGPTGGQIYADTISSAIQRLATHPPLGPLDVFRLGE